MKYFNFCNNLYNFRIFRSTKNLNSRRKKIKIIFLNIIVILMIIIFFVLKSNNITNINDGYKMISLIEKQLSYGPRYLSASGHENIQKFIIAEMKALEIETKIQTWQHTSPSGQKYELKNIIGRLYPTNTKRIILAAHYDSKKIADMDMNYPDQPVPGANDSASGVAVLLELARTLTSSDNSPKVGIDIVFFDGEEGEENLGGDYINWEPIGSTYFAENLYDTYGNNRPILGIVIDMVCDKNLKIFRDESSIKNAPEQLGNFWNIAKNIDSNAFGNHIRTEIRDDHTPMNQNGIPSFLIIDFEYPPWHTTNDTLDKCSPKSLETVANAVFNYLYSIK